MSRLIMWGLALMLFAIFRVWNQERDKREEAEKATPEVLKRQVETLQAQLNSRWQSLTDEERSSFISTLKTRPKAPNESPSLYIIRDTTHVDAMELASTLSVSGTQGDWYVPIFSDPRRPTGPPGLILEVGKNRESDAAIILQALKQIGLPDPQQTSGLPDALLLWIGRRST